MTPLTDIVLAVYVRLFCAGWLFWFGWAVTGDEWYILIMATCVSGSVIVFMPLLWITSTIDAVREYRALNRRIDQRVREAMAAEGWESF